MGGDDKLGIKFASLKCCLDRGVDHGRRLTNLCISYVGLFVAVQFI